VGGCGGHDELRLYESETVGVRELVLGRNLRSVRIRAARGVGEAVGRPGVSADSAARGDGPMRQALGLEVLY